MNTQEQLIGQYDNDKVFIYPKYYVAKFSTQSDVIIKTASKTIEDCQEKAKEIFEKTPYFLDDLVYIKIEIKQINESF